MTNNSDHWNAEKYAKHSSMQYMYATEILNDCSFQPDNTILDIGCGDGKITMLMAQEVPEGRVIGIDSSSSMIEHAKQLENNYQNLAFFQQDASQLKFQEEFDWVFSFSCLHWISDQKAVWQGIYNALKTGGHAIVHFFKKNPYLWDVIEKIVVSSEWNAYFKNYHPPVHEPFYECSTEDYSHILTECQFKIEYMKENVRMHSFDDKQALKDFIAAWLPHLSQIPISLRNTFMNQLCSHFAPKKPGIIEMPFTHRIFAVKK